MTTIKIKDKDYALKATLRAMFIYEQLTGKMFEVKTLTDEYIYFYCLLLANNKDMQMTFDEFIEALDEDLSIMQQYQDFMRNELEKQGQFIESRTDSDGKKKA